MGAWYRSTEGIVADMKRFKFNTAIAKLMVFCNYLRDILSQQSQGITKVKRDVWRVSVERLLLHIAPLAPHIAEELWAKRGHKTSIHLEKTPEYESARGHIVLDLKDIPIQINGRVRSKLRVPANCEKKEIMRLAMRDERVARWLEGKEVKKTIFVRDRIINFVV